MRTYSHGLALKSVLTSKVNEAELIVLDSLTLEGYSTKVAKEILTNLKANKTALIVLNEQDNKVYRSFKNIPGVEVAVVNQINVYDILKHDSLIMTQDAVKTTEEVYS